MSDYRTSSTAWLVPNVLGDDPKQTIIKGLEDEIARITRLNVNNQVWGFFFLPPPCHHVVSQ